MTNQSLVLDALGDPSRRGIFEALAAGPMPVGVLANRLPISRPAVSQHLRVLKAAGLVLDRPSGARRLYEIDPEGIRTLQVWLASLWNPALQSFKAVVEAQEENDMTSTTEAAFRTAITVQAPIDRAFSVFTAGFDSWWPRAHHILQADLAEVVLEGSVGGRWFERCVDGTECDWGRVLAWDPPRAIALSWHLNAQFEYDPDPDKASRVDVRFIAEGPGSTRVELAHSNLDRVGGSWPQLLSAISDEGGGWPALLGRFAARAAAA